MNQSLPPAIARFTFGLSLLLLLGANSATGYGGPFSWLPIVSLPGPGGQWVGAGLLSLLPLVSVVAWAFGRFMATPARQFNWGMRQINLPILILVALALASLLGQCIGGVCSAAAIPRLIALASAFAWVYLFIVNERPNLAPIVAAIVVLQATVSVGQYIVQHDLGLRGLGELPLDPAQIGTSVVINDGIRWLRGYGLTTHPNSAGRTLAVGVLMLMALRPFTPRRWRPAVAAAALLGLTGLLATLSRWSLACLALGLLIGAWPAVRQSIGRVRSRGGLAAAGALLPALILLGVVFGGPLVGRFTGADSSVESRSLWERQRDLAIAGRLIADEPLTGVGFGHYLARARLLDQWAEPVHNVALQLGAELGLAGLLAWLLVVVLPLPRLWRDRSAAAAGLWLGFWALGLMYVNPNPLVELRSALLAGLAAGIVSLPVLNATTIDE